MLVDTQQISEELYQFISWGQYNLDLLNLNHANLFA